MLQSASQRDLQGIRLPCHRVEVFSYPFEACCRHAAIVERRLELKQTQDGNQVMLEQSLYLVGSNCTAQRSLPLICFRMYSRKDKWSIIRAEVAGPTSTGDHPKSVRRYLQWITVVMPLFRTP